MASTKWKMAKYLCIHFKVNLKWNETLVENHFFQTLEMSKNIESKGYLKMEIVEKNMCPVISNGGTKFIMKLLDCGKIDKYPKIHSWKECKLSYFCCHFGVSLKFSIDIRLF